jgi:glycosyltransferase involved in cell wall biosynthesis
MRAPYRRVASPARRAKQSFANRKQRSGSIAKRAGYVPTVPDVILPVLDEAAAIPSVLRSLPPGFDPIVVDNASTDDSARVAAAHGARVVTELQRGFGAACWRGLVNATAEIVCFMDCDGSLDGADLIRVAAPVVRGDADLVLGARRPVAGSWPVHARVANRYLAHRVRRRTGLAIRDIGPMRAARRDDLLTLGLRDRRFGWPLEMVLRAGGAGWRVHEVPVTYTSRIGRSKVTGTILGTARTVSDMAAALR